MPELGDFSALLARREAAAVKVQREQRAAILPRITDIAYKAQTVVDHPGWQFYLDSLETRVQAIKAKRDQTAERMVTGTEMGQALELLKINLNAMDAEMAGLKFAMTLIPEAVTLGHKIAVEMAVEMNGQADAARVAH